MLHPNGFPSARRTSCERTLARPTTLIALVGLTAVAAALTAGCSSSRPQLPRSPQERRAMREKGAEVVAQAVAAHGGTENWNRVREITFRLTDEWHSPFDRVLNPWPVERAAGQNSFRLHEGWGRVAIVTDRGTVAYGLGPSGPWSLLRGQPSPEAEDERDAAYIVPTYGFLVGLPFRFQEHGAVAHYMGKAYRKYQGTSRELEEVLVTYPPEGDVFPDDWFLARFDPATHELRTITYTTAGRSAKMLETTCELTDFQVVEGLKIPMRRTCYVSAPVESKLHELTMADVRFNQVSPDTYFERQGAMSAAAGGAAPDSAAAAETAGAGAAEPGATSGGGGAR